MDKQRIKTEAAAQTKAIQTIIRWRRLSLALSTLGIAILYAGIAGSVWKTTLCIIGGLAVALGTLLSLVFNLGIKNARRNVEKMLSLLENSSMAEVKDVN